MDIAQMHYYMRQLGIGENVTDADLKKMRKALQWERAEKKGRDIARTHMLMRSLGMGETVTKDDVTLMKASLKEHRIGGSGSILGEILANMHEIGFGETVTPRDMADMKEALREDREGGRMTSEGIAYVLHDIRMLRPDLRRNSVTGPLPPLKRFSA